MQDIGTYFFNNFWVGLKFKTRPKVKRMLSKYQKYFESSEKYQLIPTHENNVILLYFPKLKIFRKFSFFGDGKKKIIAEYRGLSWYLKRKKVKKNSIIKKLYNNRKNLFKALDTKLIEGRKMKSWDSINKNFVYLKLVYKHYIKIFKKKKMTNIHGDLTLDNIIFSNNNISIIDWEFFNAKPKDWGYDIAYLFLSAISMPFILKKNISTNELLHFTKLWNLLIKQKIDKKILNNPYSYFEKSIKKDLILNKAKNISKKKFFPFITPIKFKRLILKTINENN